VNTAELRILIVGASIRAAAQSARRSGFQPVGGDLFGDADLRAICDVSVVRDYPDEFQRLFETCSFDGWMFTGALENHANLLRRWSSRWPYWGTSADDIERLRDPETLRDKLAAAGIHAPDVYRRRAPIDPSHVYLRKPLRSAGGLHIYRVPGGTDLDWSARDSYLQEFIPGTSYAAVYIAANREAQLLGVTRQLVGAAWCGATGFRYSGSIGPVAISESAESEWLRIGKALSQSFNLQGLLGVDAIVNEQGVWPVEVNPRYTASVEILERAIDDCRVIDRHVQACRDHRLLPFRRNTCNTLHGKAVIYAPAETWLTASVIQATASVIQVTTSLQNEDSWPLTADIPHPGKVRAGQPIMTIFAHAETEETVLATLQARASEIQRYVSNSPAGPESFASRRE
jgi:predicted ATP-grasp superfamily ATP-dependent carboligase